MKFVADRSFTDPEVAARKLMEIANSVEPVQDGRIHIEKINWPFLSEFKGNPAEYSAGLKFAIERGWLSGSTFRCAQRGRMSHRPFSG
jgi:hypothetical protein